MVKPHSKSKATADKKTQNLFAEEDGNSSSSSTTEEGNMDIETERVDTPPFVPETDPDTETERVETPPFLRDETDPEGEVVKNEPMAHVEGGRGRGDIARSGSPSADVSPYVRVTVQSVNTIDHVIEFKMKKVSTFQKLMVSFCKRCELKLGITRFLYDGARIGGTTTPLELGIVDGDVIEAVVEQTGGNFY